jgi:hypothetical protein
MSNNALTSYAARNTWTPSLARPRFPIGGLANAMFCTSIAVSEGWLGLCSRSSTTSRNASTSSSLYPRFRIGGLLKTTLLYRRQSVRDAVWFRPALARLRLYPLLRQTADGLVRRRVARGRPDPSANGVAPRWGRSTATAQRASGGPFLVLPNSKGAVQAYFSEPQSRPTRRSRAIRSAGRLEPR